MSLQVSIKFISNLDNFAAEQRFYGRLSSDGSSAHLAAFVPHLHDAIVGCSSTTWSGEHHPPALVLERGHFSLEVSHVLLLLLPTCFAAADAPADAVAAEAPAAACSKVARLCNWCCCSQSNTLHASQQDLVLLLLDIPLPCLLKWHPMTLLPLSVCLVLQ